MARLTQITDSTYIDLSTVYKITRRYSSVTDNTYIVVLYTACNGVGLETQVQMTNEEWQWLLQNGHQPNKIT